MTATTKDLGLQATYTPHGHHGDGDSGTDASLEGEFKSIPKDGEWESKGEIKFGGYELGPLKGWSEVSALIYSFIFICLTPVSSHLTNDIYI